MQPKVINTSRGPEDMVLDTSDPPRLTSHAEIFSTSGKKAGPAQSIIMISARMLAANSTSWDFPLAFNFFLMALHFIQKRRNCM